MSFKSGAWISSLFGLFLLVGLTGCQTASQKHVGISPQGVSQQAITDSSNTSANAAYSSYRPGAERSVVQSLPGSSIGGYPNISRSVSAPVVASGGS